MIEVSIFLIRLMPRYCLFIYFISRIIAIMFGISFLIIFSVCYYWLLYLTLTIITTGFPGGTGGKEPTCQCRRRKRCGFYPCVGKIPWRTAWESTPVLVWRVPWIGSHRVWHDWSNLAHTYNNDKLQTASSSVTYNKDLIFNLYYI